ncbi:MAG: hypothetical protein RBU37_09405 [Myxococcota bacterium]|jgi:hypothetical protein|nr:hypothetical protein [Myxococcota bacterium]
MNTLRYRYLQTLLQLDPTQRAQQLGRLVELGLELLFDPLRSQEHLQALREQPSSEAASIQPRILPTELSQRLSSAGLNALQPQELAECLSSPELFEQLLQSLSALEDLAGNRKDAELHASTQQLGADIPTVPAPSARRAARSEPRRRRLLAISLGAAICLIGVGLWLSFRALPTDSAHELEPAKGSDELVVAQQSPESTNAQAVPSEAAIQNLPDQSAQPNPPTHPTDTTHPATQPTEPATPADPNAPTDAAAQSNPSDPAADPSATSNPAEPPQEDKPKADKPKTDKPKEDKPKTDKPKADKPKEDKPKEDKPKADKPKEDKPKEDKPKDSVDQRQRIAATLKQATKRFEACVPGSARPVQVRLRFSIGADGMVESGRADGIDEPASTCLVKELRRLRFDAGDKRENVSYPIDFE